ncbi:hypothetical protein SAMD00019534_082430 [Acytostelium subglobosum LB1]|uniref:hypothetical protein n=1 Tax=Acytostelium subglobosum LB1 TaxID=1410327 RepID=UPI000644F5D6|nr:hypothetical protein SAMD00019534_082430 [Acytostelium subglobosum LB1]GAM25068.1 hypothetical protein SAMD00019534_082430 [Acytostelium subglobosum LB1]|eukprot:XP_012752157.1 hypothetical protein SAMD00019534_082430 [Acytostelium subglobosum LB1]
MNTRKSSLLSTAANAADVVIKLDDPTTPPTTTSPTLSTSSTSSTQGDDTSTPILLSIGKRAIKSKFKQEPEEERTPPVNIKKERKAKKEKIDKKMVIDEVPSSSSLAAEDEVLDDVSSSTTTNGNNNNEDDPFDMTEMEEAVYCICRKGEGDKFMLACDECNEWYHGECVGVSEADAAAIKYYACAKCKEKTTQEERNHDGTLKRLKKKSKKRALSDSSDPLMDDIFSPDNSNNNIDDQAMSITPPLTSTSTTSSTSTKISPAKVKRENSLPPLSAPVSDGIISSSGVSLCFDVDNDQVVDTKTALLERIKRKKDELSSSQSTVKLESSSSQSSFSSGSSSSSINNNSNNSNGHGSSSEPNATSMQEWTDRFQEQFPTLKLWKVSSLWVESKGNTEKAVELAKAYLEQQKTTPKVKTQPGLTQSQPSAPVSTGASALFEPDPVDDEEKTWFTQLGQVPVHPKSEEDANNNNNNNNNNNSILEVNVVKQQWAKQIRIIENQSIMLVTNMVADNTPIYFTKSNIMDNHPPQSILAHVQATHQFIGYLRLGTGATGQDLNAMVFPLLRTGFVRMVGTLRLVSYQSNQLAAVSHVTLFLTYKSHLTANDKTLPTGMDLDLPLQGINPLNKFLTELGLISAMLSDNPQMLLAPDNLDGQLDFISTNLQKLEPPPLVKVTLRSHQLEGHWWMMNRERNPETSFNTTLNSYWRRFIFNDGTPFYYNLYSDKISLYAPMTETSISGGCLFDDMGLGKTIMSICTIMGNHPKYSPHPQHAEILRGLRKHNSYFRNKPLPKTTLIICPNSLIINWRKELTKFVNKDVGLRILEYCGPGRHKNLRDFENHDIVLTTPNTFALEFKSYQSESRRAPLNSVYWWRVIVDEAQYNKPKTLFFKALSEMRSVNRWLLTGTPVQNYLEEMYPHLHFLQVHPVATDIGSWRSYIERTKNIPLLRSTLKPILLRRTKMTVGMIDLPPKTVEIVRLQFDVEESEYYNAIFEEAAKFIDALYRQGGILKNYASVLAKILRLRQICDHRMLVIQKRGSDDVAEECQICDDSPQYPVMNICKHWFCLDCILDRIKTEQEGGNDSPKCPECKLSISLNQEELRDTIAKKKADDEALEAEARAASAASLADKLKRDPDGNFAAIQPTGLRPQTSFSLLQRAQDLCNSSFTSTKVKALLQQMNIIFDQEKGCKIVIFSQWTTMLDRIEDVFHENGWKREERYERFDGTMSQIRKNEAVERFQEEGGPVVMLISLKAGGVGLNLTRASKVFMVDPWWNVAMENQAIDRLHRIGQTRPVVVKKFIIERSIEERILELQQSKEDMTQAILDEKYDPTKKIRKVSLSLEDIRLLFTGFEGQYKSLVGQRTAAYVAQQLAEM